MPAYYNEFDPYAAQWLRNLIAAGHIAPGDVDERSILEVTADDLRGYEQCHFFAGIGGWSAALRLAGWPDDRPVWTGSCPCQPFSTAGKQRGSEDERHLWPTFFRLINERRPATVFGEQVAGASGLAWLDHVLADLEGAGYAAGAAALPACSVGADHKRERLYWSAHSEWNKQPREESCSWKIGRMGRIVESIPWDRDWQSALAGFRAVGDGIPRSVAGTDAARNAIVPQLAAVFVMANGEVRGASRLAGEASTSTVVLEDKEDA